MASINIRMTKKDLEDTEFEILDKMDDVKEELTKKIDGKIIKHLFFSSLIFLSKFWFSKK